MVNRLVEKLSRYVDLTPEEVGALQLVTSQPKLLVPRQNLAREGEKPGPILVVLEGWAFRYKMLPNGSRQIMAFLMPGDACDLHIDVLAEMDHSIQTLTVAGVATIEAGMMAELMSSYPGIARAMYIAQLSDEGTLRAWMANLGRRSSVESLAHLLLELYARTTPGGISASNEIDFPLSQAVLADALGVTTVHINRVLQNLRRSGAIELHRGLLRINNPEALTQISGFNGNYLHRTALSQVKSPQITYF